MTPEPSYRTSLKESYASKIWLFRTAQGLSQAEFARIVGIDRTTVSQAELGKLNISIDLLERFWRVLSHWDAQPTPELIAQLRVDEQPLLLKNKLGLRLRRIREEKNFTQEKLGPMMGFDQKMMGRIERGEHSTALDQVQRICDFLSVDAEEILEQSLIDVFGSQ